VGISSIYRHGSICSLFSSSFITRVPIDDATDLHAWFFADHAACFGQRS
jgi:hypothetical protein